MNAIKEIIEKASKLNGTVVLPEGMDPRVVTAACACVDRKICTPVVLGTAAEIAAAEEKAGLKLVDRGIKTIDYTLGDAELENAYLEAWNAKESKKPAEKQKIIDLAGAQKTLRTKRIYFRFYRRLAGYRLHLSGNLLRISRNVHLLLYQHRL